ncbi:aminotransferase [Prosthecomicrobium sp. N25]|uniref:aminotransferase n=1 Tax=Prosthecomicrobium sp. N25 TaxID=3129254 RepID=UPI003077E9BF
MTAPLPLPNPWLAATEAPPIPVAQAWTAAYDGRAGRLLNLSQAAPGDPPPPALLERLAAAAADPAVARYGPIAGDAALRDALAADIAARYGGTVGADDIVVTSGCNQAFFIALMAVARAGDEVILPAPWYFNHKMMLDMLGIAAVPLVLDAAAGFVPDPAAARALIGPRTRAIALVSPNNPTGATYPPAVLDAFLDLAAETGLHLVLDETYRDFLPPGRDRPHGLFARPDWGRNLVHLYSFSKSYAVPGHRVGALVAGPALMGEMAKVQDCIQICAPRAAQAALAWAIPGIAPWRANMRDRINARAARFAAGMERLGRWKVDQIGAYFAFVRHPFGQGSAAVAERLCREAGLLVLPGAWFGPGGDAHLRIAFANVEDADMDNIVDRLAGLD